MLNRRRVANASVAGVGITGVMIGVRGPDETVAAFAVRIPGNVPVRSFVSDLQTVRVQSLSSERKFSLPYYS